MSTVQPVYEWNTVPWKQVEKRVFKLQKRIYQASSRGDVKTVRRLQRLLIKSHSAKLLAVRRVTQDNQGKRTAGIDGVKSLPPKARLALVNRLSLKGKARPVRRIYIPKPGTQARRALGIPVMEDRAKQALVKLALEPAWEAKFEPNSYGFRPGRSAHDAISAIRKAIDKRSKFVLDADIEKCFDRIDHAALLKKLDCSPTVRRVIKGWLKSGVLDGNTLFPTESGTPQGGVISPLLANITLHGLETDLRRAFPATGYVDGKRQNPYAPIIVRYADDLVILHAKQEEIEKAHKLTDQWLNQYGLRLKPSKTRITHTLETGEGTPGFDFLGFNIRQYRVSSRRSGKTPLGEPLGYKTLIQPSQMSVKRFKQRLKGVVVNHRSGRQSSLIHLLNSLIRGWCYYFRTENSATCFHQLNQDIFDMLWGWANRRHRNKGKTWIYDKYWRRVEGSIRFADTHDHVLLKPSMIRVMRHVKVQGTRSPYDGDWVYWSRRITKAPKYASREFRILVRQQGRCAHCRLFFKAGDLIEFDHILPSSLGGTNGMDNLQALHRHCHDSKTAQDGSCRSAHVTSPNVEEPCEAKVSRTVLKPSREGDLPA